MNQTFCIHFQTHPKTLQNQLREILFDLRQKYTGTFPRIFLDFPGLFPGFRKLVVPFYDNFYGGSADGYSARRERERPTSGKSPLRINGRKTEGQASFGVDSGPLWGDPGETLGGQRGVGGGRRRPKKKMFIS